MPALRLLVLLMLGRAAVVSTDPREATASIGDERVSAEVVFNRGTGEFRVLTNMGRAAALDVQHDLDRCATRDGSHVYLVALGSVLGAGRPSEPS